MDMTLKLTREQAKCLLDALCVYDRETRANIARCSAAEASPTAKALVDSYKREKSLGEELRKPLYRMAFADEG